MNFKPHLEIKDHHAFLSPSQYHWLNYDEEKMAQVFASNLAKEKGTELHEFAARAIRLGEKLRASHKTLNMHINDAIGFKMTAEQPLYFSRNCFGTADAISFRNNFLRIHDLKTGSTPAKMDQLMVYAALFCLEYGYKPTDIKVELRIYQFDDINVYEPTADEIVAVMDQIIRCDRVIESIREKGY